MTENLTSPENLPAEPIVPNSAVPDSSLPPQPPTVTINPYAENPPWTGFDAFLIVLFLLVALFVSTSIAMGIVMISDHTTSAGEMAKNPGAYVVVPPMTFSYVAMLIFMYGLVTRLRHRRFWEAVSWQWPKGWLVYLAAGGFLAFALGLLSHFLPVPKSLPMDRFFRDRQSAYLMAFFGVVVAPLAEEMLFRGFLYPALDRWLQTAFTVSKRLQHGSFWLVLIVGWGYVSHRLPSMWAILLAIVVFLSCAGVFLFRSLSLSGKPATDVLLPGISILVWGLLANSLANRAFIFASLALLVGAVIPGVIGFASSLNDLTASHVGRFLAIVATAASFAMVHSDQLGRAWAPLLMLFLVGLVLTITRAVTRSLAPGYLIHVGYNLTLFGLMYVATDHFRHMEKLSQ